MSVTLAPMDDADFIRFAERAVAEYSDGMVAAGEWTRVQASQKARSVFEQLLPQGRLTEDNQLWVIKTQEHRIGELWVVERYAGVGKIAFILDIYIDPGERRQGYARQSLLALESWARQAGCEEVRLHVFGSNAAARRLYEQLGYGIASLTMAKPLPST
ncbi:GNAT family N-acetyltransferase [Pseudomonas batumici]|uniref:Histone acetyltransferase HPA2 n=1 Tax=Pseudomonas batumici TaxID=226910 RepID=A0A0C2I8Z5_9PSED|nr:GNAT family N-acetyltransferase [Pseudomonas batumici]KIH85696.1 Histone acetyltransferase HPA2 [Pseudomonas batumici]